MDKIFMMYISLMPPILSGILNMVWCKLTVVKALKAPMDAGRTLSDGKRIFGDNKTWHGFIGYLILNTVISVLWGAFLYHHSLSKYNYFYINHENALSYNMWIGLLLGLGYAVFELPNSFIKRRLGVEAGKTSNDMKKPIFIFLDQADSVIGCALVVWLHYDIGFQSFLEIIIVGAFTHIILNILLYFAHLRKNMF